MSKQNTTPPRMTLKQELVIRLLTETDKTLTEIAGIAKTNRSLVNRYAKQFLGPDFMQKRKDSIAANHIAQGLEEASVSSADDDVVQIVEHAPASQSEDYVEASVQGSAFALPSSNVGAVSEDKPENRKGVKTAEPLPRDVFAKLPPRIQSILSNKFVKSFLYTFTDSRIKHRKILHLAENISKNGTTPKTRELREIANKNGFAVSYRYICSILGIFRCGIRATSHGYLLMPDWYTTATQSSNPQSEMAFKDPGFCYTSKKTVHDDAAITIQFKDIKLCWAEPDGSKRTDAVLRVLQELRGVLNVQAN